MYECWQLRCWLYQKEGSMGFSSGIRRESPCLFITHKQQSRNRKDDVTSPTAFTLLDVRRGEADWSIYCTWTKMLLVAEFRIGVGLTKQSRWLIAPGDITRLPLLAACTHRAAVPLPYSSARQHQGRPSWPTSARSPGRPRQCPLLLWKKRSWPEMKRRRVNTLPPRPTRAEISASKITARGREVNQTCKIPCGGSHFWRRIFSTALAARLRLVKTGSRATIKSLRTMAS